MKDDKLWSRRKFSKAVISAQVLLASGILTLPLSCIDNKKPAKDQVLSDSMKETLRFAMDEIIPANDKMPSASAIGGVEYILKILDELPDLVSLFQHLLSTIETQSLENSSKNFVNLNSSDRIDGLINFEKTEAELFGVLKNFTYESYYTNPQVFELINYEPHPTGTIGPSMVPFDERLLDRIKNLPPMYTKI